METPLEGFFSQFPQFQSQPSNSPVVEFDRLCKSYEWERNDPEKKAARKGFQVALKMEFNDLYGSDEKNIANWHKLCFVLRIDPAPNTLRECRAVSCLFSEPLCTCSTKVSSFCTGCPHETRQPRRLGPWLEGRSPNIRNGRTT